LIKEQNPSVKISKEVLKNSIQADFNTLFEDSLTQMSSIIHAQKEDYERIEKLLENLSVMILSNQKTGDIDQEA